MEVKVRINPTAGFTDLGLGIRAPNEATMTFLNIKGTRERLPKDADGIGLSVQLVEGVYRITGLTSPRGLTSTMLRKLPLDGLLRVGMARGGILGRLSEPKPVTRADESVLETVAALHRIAQAVGYPAINFIADYYRKPKPTVSSWVKAARDRGLLEGGQR